MAVFVEAMLSMRLMVMLFMLMMMHFPPMMMIPVTVMMFLLLMVMPVFVLMMMVVFLLMVVLGMRVGRPFVDCESHGIDVLPRLALPMGVKLANLDFAQLPFEGRRFHAQIAEGADSHIAADAGEAVDIENTHRRALFHRSRHFPSALAKRALSALI